MGTIVSKTTGNTNSVKQTKGIVIKRSKTKRLKIDLYLEKINQEMINIGPGAVSGCDFYVKWSKSCCILDFSLVKPGDLVSQPYRGFLLRKEEEGGMMWNPRTGAVYKLNDDAYHAVLDLENGYSELEIARRNDLGLRAVQGMIRKLKKLV